MIQVICPKCVGLIHSCTWCGAIFKYEMEDVYEKKYIYCPICKEKQECALQIKYNGIIKEKDEKEKIIND